MTTTLDDSAASVDDLPGAPPRGAILGLPNLGAIGPLLVAVALLMAGAGLGSSLIGIRAGVEGFGTSTVGVIMAGYYVGFLAGSVVAPGLIRRVGHIRVFSGLASLASVGVLVHVVVLDASAWWLLRLVTGFCVAGLFVVTETWLNGAVTNATRGTVLAGYMVVVTGGQAVGQLLLNLADPAGFGAFVLTSALVSLAVVPVALSSVVRAPEPSEPAPFTLRELIQVAPLAAAGAAVSGFAGAVVVGLGAVYAAESGLSVARTSVLLFTTLAAAVVLQFPIGRASDRVDRRRVIAAVAIVAALLSVVATQLGGPDRFVALVPVAALAGGLSFTLYSLANAHLNDYLPAGALVAAGALMVLVNGFGAVVGPIAASIAIETGGADWFFAVLAVVYVVTGAYALYRLTRRPAVSPSERAAFVPLPTGTAPTIAALSPGAADELYPVSTDSFERDGATLHWYQRGGGAPVMLVHDAGSSSAIWSDVSLTFADLAYQSLSFDLRGHGRSSHQRSYSFDDHIDDLHAVMNHHRIASCPLVGHGHGAVIAAAYAAKHPERVDALVLVSSDHLFAAPQDRARKIRGTIARPLARIIEGGVAEVMQSRVGAKLGAAAVYGHRRDPRSYRRLATDLRLADPTAVTNLRRSARQRAAGGALLEQLTMPVLHVRGATSRPPRLAAVVVEGAGYFVQLDRPIELTVLIDRFVRETRPATIGE